MAFSYWAREAALTLDWNEVYADFKDKNCSIASYHKFYFPKFCHRFGIDYVLGYNAVRRYIRKMMEGEYGANKMQAVQAAENSLTQQPTKTGEPENTPSCEPTLHQASFFSVCTARRTCRQKACRNGRNSYQCRQLLPAIGTTLAPLLSRSLG